jgi:two-component system chemotaxis response regulator CheB
MAPIKTVIVDDSAFVRKVVRDMLNPDVVTCDLVMPELDGVGFVRQQMTRKALPILLLTASPQDTTRVLEALEAGAVDFIQKPTALANDDLLFMREELIEKVKAAALSRSHSGALMPAPTASAPISRPATNMDIVVLGVSTGGPQALRYLLPQFAADFPVPLVIVLHMPIGYTAPFAEKLAEISRLPIKEAFEGCPLEAGQALLAPAGRHLSFRRNGPGRVVVQLSVQPMDKPHRPSVDVLFQSAAETYRERVLGVVMTGMGDDGTQGSAWVKAQGGTILTQDQESSVIYGMPRSVVEAGLSDAAVSLAAMAGEINKRL